MFFTALTGKGFPLVFSFSPFQRGKELFHLGGCNLVKGLALKVGKQPVVQMLVQNPVFFVTDCSSILEFSIHCLA